MLAIYASAILLSAALLFTVQPMVAKMILPRLGGTPVVWNTCMVFFQAGLLLGYAYAHGLTRRLRPRAQLAVHAVVLLLPFLVLPLRIRASTPSFEGGAPIAWLLGTLALAVGLPFFAVSVTAPLLQRWLATTDHGAGRDPYFLYAASNAGSLGGLLAYPLLLEPLFPLGVAPEGGTGPGGGISQGELWTAGYAVFALLALAAGVLMLRRNRNGTPRTDAEEPSRPVTAGDRVLWVALAAVPSSVLLGSTQYLTTDLAAVPLLWVVPLALYLLTFVLAFARGPRLPAPVSGTLLGIATIGIAVEFSPDVPVPLPVSIGLHLAALFFAALACHHRLADHRPSADHLTEFYLLIAAGGVLGGTFNALLAPLLFDHLFEYPLALILACLLRAPWQERERRPGILARAADLLLPAAILAVGLAAAKWLPRPHGERDLLRIWLVLGLPAAFALALIGWRLRFALACAVVFGLSWRQAVGTADLQYAERTYFGILRVVTVDGAPLKFDASSGMRFHVPYRVLIHGGTRHGTQALLPTLGGKPTTYYHPSGPVGQIFETFGEDTRFDRIVVVGLGVGTIAAYGRDGQRMRFYEVDPEVVRVARDSGLFTYLDETAAEVDVEVGDGRILLSRAPDDEFGLVALDAFSSDSIPMHLITREAIALAFRKASPDGLVLVNVTNRYLEMEPVVAAIARDLGLVAKIRRDSIASPREAAEGKDASVWALLARREEALGPIAEDPRWTIARAETDPPPARYLWTDEYSNLLAVLRPE